jgi:hypothetical protein
MRLNGSIAHVLKKMSIVVCPLQKRNDSEDTVIFSLQHPPMQSVHTTFGLEQSARPFALISMYEVVKFESCIGASRGLTSTGEAETAPSKS